VECYDLAIGAPGEDVGSAADAGYAYIIDGGVGGLSTSSDQGIYQDASGIANVSEVNDRFGAELEVVDGSPYDGLRARVPGENLTCLDPDVSYERWHTFDGSTGGVSTSGDAVECEPMEWSHRTGEWADLAEAARWQTRRVLNHATGPM